MSLSPYYKGLSALYRLPGCILAFHFEGLSLFSLILIPSRLHWKTSMLCYELWWHCSWVISSLMWLAKWVQNIECGGDGCFIYNLPFFTCWQISLLFLGLCLMVFGTGLWSFRGQKSILGVLRHYNLPRLMISCLYFSQGPAVNVFRGLFF